jgi:hypothetical protein
MNDHRQVASSRGACIPARNTEHEPAHAPVEFVLACVSGTGAIRSRRKDRRPHKTLSRDKYPRCSGELEDEMNEGIIDCINQVLPIAYIEWEKRKRPMKYQN